MCKTANFYSNLTLQFYNLMISIFKLKLLQSKKQQHPIDISFVICVCIEHYMHTTFDFVM